MADGGRLEVPKVDAAQALDFKPSQMIVREHYQCAHPMETSYERANRHSNVDGLQSGIPGRRYPVKSTDGHMTARRPANGIAATAGTDGHSDGRAAPVSARSAPRGAPAIDAGAAPPLSSRSHLAGVGRAALGLVSSMPPYATTEIPATKPTPYQTTNPEDTFVNDQKLEGLVAKMRPDARVSPSCGASWGGSQVALTMRNVPEGGLPSGDKKASTYKSTFTCDTKHPEAEKCDKRHHFQRAEMIEIARAHVHVGHLMRNAK
eukprot:TRINITY_DN77713_c0_g1_i1.p1 TRINITY_DN77713_c0_g1~~TRINITY_DN77713_c0_g1_i1.p1  ORF type:complete len:282 (+),score=20.49 TRINITY_DN77713_c0_g1_i1:63-848(+)